MNLVQLEALMRLMRERGALHVQCGDIVVTLGGEPAPVDVEYESHPEKESDPYDQLGLPAFDTAGKVQ